MAFDYPVNLDLDGKSCLVAGSGPLAIDRLTGLLRARALVTVITPAPSLPLAAQCEAFNTLLLKRPLMVDDLDGVTLAIVTREDDVDVAAMHAAAQERRVLFAALDDIPHCDFGAMSQIRRGSLTVTVSSGGRAPALAKRLRRKLDQELSRELSQLLEAVAATRRAHGPRDMPFDEWARRWEQALEDLDGLLALLAGGERERVEAMILHTLRTPSTV